MLKQIVIRGHVVNCECSKDGKTIRSATVLVGDADKAGWRLKDGAVAKRKAVRAELAAALALPIAAVRVASQYTCLRQRPDGLIERRDGAGRVTGVHLP